MNKGFLSGIVIDKLSWQFKNNGLATGIVLITNNTSFHVASVSKAIYSSCYFAIRN
jgi:hypothetical protein